MLCWFWTVWTIDQWQLQWRALVAQCCNPIRGMLLFRRKSSTCKVWVKPNHEKGNCLSEGHLCICPTNQPLHKGDENSQKKRPELSIPDHGLQGRGFESHTRTFAFFILNLAIMGCNDVQLLQCAYYVPVGMYSIVCGRFHWMATHSFTSENIAHGKKRSNI